jgi:hypothetical protein
MAQKLGDLIQSSTDSPLTTASATALALPGTAP